MFFPHQERGFSSIVADPANECPDEPFPILFIQMSINVPKWFARIRSPGLQTIGEHPCYTLIY